MTNVKKMKGIKRIQTELDNLMNDQDVNNCFGVDYWDQDSDNPDVKHWQITLIPPKGTDYEGGYFKIEVKFDETYPDKPPKMKFVTKIYHCNISEENGHICLNSLKGSWKPSMTIEDILKHIIILLYKQNPDDPMNSDAAKVYLKSEKEFKDIVTKKIKEFANINDFENLKKQNIELLENCKCFDCAGFGLFLRRRPPFPSLSHLPHYN